MVCIDRNNQPALESPIDDLFHPGEPCSVDCVRRCRRRVAVPCYRNSDGSETGVLVVVKRVFLQRWIPPRAFGRRLHGVSDVDASCHPFGRVLRRQLRLHTDCKPKHKKNRYATLSFHTNLPFLCRWMSIAFRITFMPVEL